MADLQPGGVNQSVCLAHTGSVATGDAFDLDPRAYIRKKWHNATNGRHYQADLYRDLFEAWILIRSWRGDRHRGNEKMAVVASYQDGLAQIKRIDSTRTRRGYRRVD